MHGLMRRLRGSFNVPLALLYWLKTPQTIFPEREKYFSPIRSVGYDNTTTMNNPEGVAYP